MSHPFPVKSSLPPPVLEYSCRWSRPSARQQWELIRLDVAKAGHWQVVRSWARLSSVLLRWNCWGFHHPLVDCGAFKREGQKRQQKNLRCFYLCGEKWRDFRRMVKGRDWESWKLYAQLACTQLVANWESRLILAKSRMWFSCKRDPTPRRQEQITLIAAHNRQLHQFSGQNSITQVQAFLLPLPSNDHHHHHHHHHALRNLTSSHLPKPPNTPTIPPSHPLTSIPSFKNPTSLPSARGR